MKIFLNTILTLVSLSAFSQVGDSLKSVQKLSKDSIQQEEIVYDTIQKVPYIILKRRTKQSPKLVTDSIKTSTPTTKVTNPVVTDTPPKAEIISKPEVIPTPSKINHNLVTTPEQDLERLKSLIHNNLKDIHSEQDKKFFELLKNNDIYNEMELIRNDISNNSTVYYPELSKDTLIARLKILNKKTPFDITYNPILENLIKGHLKNRQKSMQRLMSLAQYYFPIFEARLDAYNIPIEIKYLAIVESALNPKIKSRVGATGLWQFMFSTGKAMGLDVNSYVDERSDVLKSTEAACKYLSKLYDMFGDWDLALASYNCGPGNVRKAIRRSGGKTNYWNIRPFLPRETAGYVPMFQTKMYIFEYAKEHNFTPDTAHFNYFETDTIHVKKRIALKHVSDIFDIPLEDVQFLNPSYKLDIIPQVKGKQYTLRLPVALIHDFIRYENDIYAYAEKLFNKREKPLPKLLEVSNRFTYRVKSGDFLGKIASKYRVKVSQIKRWNGLRSNNLKIGQRLVIYTNGHGKSKKKKSSKKNLTATKHTVKKGEYLYTISRKYKVTVEALKKANGLKNNNLNVGMVLKIPR